MGGGDILPALEKGTIDAAEWCCPKPDSVFGFQKVLKHYYLQGLHQVVVNADMYVNRDFYDGLTDLEEEGSGSGRERVAFQGAVLPYLRERQGAEGPDGKPRRHPARHAG
jgi:hypothetical protein